MALTHKKQVKQASEMNELLRATWQAQYGDIPAEYLFWLDKDDMLIERETGSADAFVRYL